MIDRDDMSDAEAFDRFMANDPHDVGVPPPRYTGEQLQADIFKLGCGLNRLAAGKLPEKKAEDAK